MERQINLVLLRSALNGDRNFRAVESVVLEHTLEICLRLVEFVLGVKFAELQAARGHELVRRRTAGNTVRGDLAYEIVRNGKETQSHASSRTVSLGLNVSEAAGGEQGLHGIV